MTAFCVMVPLQGPAEADFGSEFRGVARRARKPLTHPSSVHLSFCKHPLPGSESPEPIVHGCEEPSVYAR
jgi:hypothetical protein